MKIVSVSNDAVFHENIRKSINFDVRLDEDGLSDFEFGADDIVLFDTDELEDLLHLVLLRARVFCVTKSHEDLKGYKLLKKGARGYGKSEYIPSALSVMKKNQVWIYPELMSFIIQNSTIPTFSNSENPEKKLSKKELEVAKLISQGLSNQEISDSLNISLRTVKAHVSSSFVKLNLKDRVALAMLVKEYFG